MSPFAANCHILQEKYTFCFINLHSCSLIVHGHILKHNVSLALFLFTACFALSMFPYSFNSFSPPKKPLCGFNTTCKEATMPKAFF